MSLTTTPSKYSFKPNKFLSIFKIFPKDPSLKEGNLDASRDILSSPTLKFKTAKSLSNFFSFSSLFVTFSVSKLSFEEISSTSLTSSLDKISTCAFNSSIFLLLNSASFSSTLIFFSSAILFNSFPSNSFLKLAYAISMGANSFCFCDISSSKELFFPFKAVSLSESSLNSPLSFSISSLM